MNPTFQDQDRGEYCYYSQQIDVHHQFSTSNPITVSKGESAMAKKKKRQKGEGVRLSTDPQSVAARERRHRISHRLKTLQSMVPGAAKMDTVSLLDHAIHYVHFLNSQIRLHQFLLLSNYSDVAPPLLPVTVPDHPFLLPPPDYANGCCFGDADEALPLWPDAGAFEDEGCYCSGGSTSTLNF